MLELFGVIVVWLTVAVVAVGTVIMFVVSTLSPHFGQRKAKGPRLDKATAARNKEHPVPIAKSASAPAQLVEALFVDAVIGTRDIDGILEVLLGATGEPERRKVIRRVLM